MTLDEAKKAAFEGEKITHTYFLPGEWVTIRKGKVIDEMGMKHSIYIFFSHRNSERFANGWSIYKS